jgi:dihydrofolate reductase
MRAIIAVNNLGYIGKNNKMLWYCPEDFKHFKEKTMGGRLLVGYNTSLELPPLKGREVVIDTRGYWNPYVEVIDWCIGGKKTYEKYAHMFSELHISHINNNEIGDIMFPDLQNLNKECKVFNYYFNL